MNSTERLNQYETIQQPIDAFGPIIRLEDHVAIQPRYFTARAREGSERYVEQSLFLPHDVPAAQLDENVRVSFSQFELRSESQLDGNERNAQTLAEYR